jgi:hypothetical protein
MKTIGDADFIKSLAPYSTRDRKKGNWVDIDIIDKYPYHVIATIRGSTNPMVDHCLSIKYAREVAEIFVAALNSDGVR